MKKRADFGSLLLILIVAVTLVLLCLAEPTVLHTPEESLTFTSCGPYDDGIFEYDTLEFYAVSSLYKSPFLEIPGTCEGFTVDSVDTRAFVGTPVKYVLLPDSIRNLKFRSGPIVELFTDNEDLARQARDQGFTVAGRDAYYALLEAVSSSRLSFRNIVPNFTRLAGSSWIIVVALGLYFGVLLCAKLRKKSGREDPLKPEKGLTTLSHGICIAVQILGGFLMFYFMLFETEEIGINADWMMEKMLNWPLKLTVGLFALVLLFDLLHKDFIPWFFGRAIVRAIRVLIGVGIGAALGALLGSLSLQLRFIVHLVAAAPIPLFYILFGCVACLLYMLLGLIPHKKRKEGNMPQGDGFAFGEEDDDDYPRGGGTTTLIGPDGTSYPVHRVGYGYMVNGKMLRDFDPHGDNRPVDENGTEYTRY